MCISSSLEGIGLNNLDFTVFQTGSLFPFHDVFSRAIGILPACVYDYFNPQDGYEFLPFKHVNVYLDGDIPDYLIWVSHYCNFWCEVFDPLIMERHLCADCVVIPPEIRTSFRQLVYERVCVHIKQLFDIDNA
jgi:hypothetical protein